jgi:hypothetical protein
LLAFDTARNTNVLALPKFGLLRAPPEALEMRSELEELWLDYNRLQTIPSVYVVLRLNSGSKPVFHKQRPLHPPSQQFSTLSRYANMVRLKVMHLEHNQIDRLPGGSSFFYFNDNAAFESTFIFYSSWQNSLA